MAAIPVPQALAIAVEHHQAGEFDQAGSIYRGILQVAPDHTDALHLLGVIAHQAGEHQLAVERISRAIALVPDEAVFHSNLGAAYEALGKLSEAVTACQRALRIQPDLAVAHNNLGKALSSQEKTDEAEASYRRALEIQPDYADALCNLFGLLLRLEKLDEAETCCRRALEIQPDSVAALHNLGDLLKCQRKLDEADTCYRRALEIEPDCTKPLAGLARLLEWRNHVEEGADMAAKCLRLEPDDPRASLVAAQCEGRQGRHREAIERLENLFPLAERGEPFLRDICFHLGHLYDRIGDAERAFANFAEANRLSAQSARKDLADKEQFLRSIATYGEVFSREWVDSWSPVAPAAEGETPVFLVGFPRSGTTLLDVVLDSHPDVQTVYEIPAVIAMGKEIKGPSGEYFRALADLTPVQVAGLRAAYFREVGESIDRRPGHVLVDKFPLNLVHTGLILRVFPGARFIVAVRHPCDVCLSCFMQDFSINPAMANFFTLEGAANLYDKAMSLWRQYVRVLPHSYHVVKYENLVDDFEGQIRSLLQFIGVDWNDAVHDYAQRIGRRGGVDTPSYNQVTEPIYRRACNRWHRYAEHFRPVMGLLEPHIERFGYESSVPA